MKSKHVALAAVILTAFYAGTLVPSVHSQSEPASYYQIDFMKIVPGGAQEYLSVEQEIWKPVHQERVKNGNLNSWWLFESVYPSGTGQEYNYATVNVFSNIEDLENPGYAELFPKVHGGQSVQDFSERTVESRDLVNSELWRLVDYVQ